MEKQVKSNSLIEECVSNTVIVYSGRNETKIVAENMFKDYEMIEIQMPTRSVISRIPEIHPWMEMAEIESTFWVDINRKLIQKEVLENLGVKYSQVIFYGIDEVILEMIRMVIEQKDLMQKNENGNEKEIKIKIISDIYEGLIFYPRERKPYLEVLDLVKNGKIDKIYYMKKSVAEAYKIKGINAGHIIPNYVLNSETKKELIEKREEKLKNAQKTIDEKINIGVYVYDNEWYNNIYNTLSIGAFIPNSLINYRLINERAQDFLETHNINSTPVVFDLADEKKYAKQIAKNDVVLELQFINNFNLNYLLASELGVPAVIGNTSDFFEILPNELLEKYVVSAEDNPHINFEYVLKIVEKSNKEKVSKEMIKWKEEYNKLAKESIERLVSE